MRRKIGAFMAGSIRTDSNDSNNNDVRTATGGPLDQSFIRASDPTEALFTSPLAIIFLSLETHTNIH